MSVLMAENHTVDRVMGDPDQGVKQDLGEPGEDELGIDDVTDVRKLLVGHLDLETACEFYKAWNDKSREIFHSRVLLTRIRSVLTRRSLDLGSIGCLYRYTRS